MIRKFAAALVLSLCVLGLPSYAKDKVMTFGPRDKDMSAAIQKAQQTLPQFWKMKRRPEIGVGGFSLKVGISDPGSSYTEHFWLRDIKRLSKDKIQGIIDNDPNNVKSVKLGQRYTFTKSDVSDWLYRRRGKIVGAWTLRVMVKRMPKAQADRFRRMLE